MRVIKTSKDVQAHCSGCDSNVHAVVDVTEQQWMCIDCLSDALSYLLRAGSFFDHFGFIRELADTLSRELGQLQKKDGSQPQAESEAAFVMCIAANGVAEAAANAAHITNGLSGEPGVRASRYLTLANR